MVQFVADTHAVVWRVTAPRRLGRRAERAFEAADSGRWLCLIPAIVLVEVALLRERGRVPVDAAGILKVLNGRLGYAMLALDGEQALEFATLVGIKDPMDRMILSAARVSGGRLVSSDEVFDGTGVERVWD